MAYREFEKAALQKLAQIDASGPYHERQIYLANRGWEKTSKSGKSLKEEVTAAQYSVLSCFEVRVALRLDLLGRFP